MRTIMMSFSPEIADIIMNGKCRTALKNFLPRLEFPYRVLMYTRKRTNDTPEDCTVPAQKVVGYFDCDGYRLFETELYNKQEECYEAISTVSSDGEPDELGVMTNLKVTTEHTTPITCSDDFDTDEEWDEHEVFGWKIKNLRPYMGRGFKTAYGLNVSSVRIFDEPQDLAFFKVKHAPNNFVFVNRF